MLSGFNYSSNNNYNVSNSNPNYISQYNQNKLKSMFRDDSNFNNRHTIQIKINLYTMIIAHSQEVKRKRRMVNITWLHLMIK